MILRAKKGFSGFYVAAALAMASAGGYAGMGVVENMVQDSYVHAEIQNRFSLRTSLQSAFDRQGHYEGLSNRIVKLLSNVPTKMKRGEGNNIETHWSSNGIVVQPEDVNGRKNNAFSMTYLEVSQRGCVGMSSNYDTFLKVEVNDIITYDQYASAEEEPSLLTFEQACMEGDNTLKFYSL